MIMSFWSWAIIVQKHILLRASRAEATVFDRAFWSGEPLDVLFEKIGTTPTGPSEKIFASGMLEWRRSHRQDGGLIAGAQARIDRAMDVAISREGEVLNKGLSFLATVGFAGAARLARTAGVAVLATPAVPGETATAASLEAKVREMRGSHR